MTKKAKKRLYRIIVAAVLFLIGEVMHFTGVFKEIPFEVFIFIAAYFVAGYDVIIKAASNIKSGRFMDENFLMSIATIGALCIGEYGEAGAVMILYQIGELFSDIAVHRSRTSLKALMDLRPDYAVVITEDGTRKVSPDEVRVGDTIQVLTGERIPLDGVVIEGSSSIDVSAVLGESIPESAVVGDTVTGGCIAKDGTLKIRVTTEYKDSAVAKIIAMGEMAYAKKSRKESFVTRFARVYTPIVVGLAVAIIAVPTLIFSQPFNEWFHRGLMFLVVSCPCALVVSVPLAFFCGMGGASKCGILAKGSSSLEMLAEIDTICFDKTGTLTDGRFAVKSAVSKVMSSDELLDLAAAIEAESTHPIGISIAAAGNGTKYKTTNTQSNAGKGVSAEIDGVRYYAGTARWLNSMNIFANEVAGGVHIAKDGEYLGYIIIGDTMKNGVIDAIKELHTLGVKKTVMLTGGSKESAKAAADELGITDYNAELMPEDKLKVVEQLCKDRKVAFVGDGINDVPVLARANVGISMGVVGTDAALQASDVVLMNDELTAIPTAIKIARRTTVCAMANIVISLLVKVVVMVLCAIGIANMWVAIFADVGVCMMAVANSVRMLRVKKYQKAS